MCTLEDNANTIEMSKKILNPNESLMKTRLHQRQHNLLGVSILSLGLYSLEMLHKHCFGHRVGLL